MQFFVIKFSADYTATTVFKLRLHSIWLVHLKFTAPPKCKDFYLYGKQ